MNTSTHCPACNAAIPADAPGGICPSCALLGVAQPTVILPPQRLASREEVAAAFPELEVMEMIGQGGMGVVFKARQPRLDRLVALKILPPHLAAQPGFSERFTREARALAKLHHPNIVTVFDFGESGGFFYLLMEFVNGVNLRKAMQSGVKPEQAMLLVPKICEALQFAHDHGVLHRDIKPENILLDTTGTPKLADFGIAKLADDKNSGLTLSGAALGTVSYMAPEQIEKPATVDHRADIYSLGVVFYEMLTGELPLGRFGAPSEKANVSEGVDAVVMRALEKERERRQQSAGEMKTQVEHAAPGGCQLTSRPAEHSPQEADGEPPGGVKHFLGHLTALAGIGIPASAVMPWMRSLGLTPTVMVFVCAGLGVLTGMWPGGRKRRSRASTVPGARAVDVICSRKLFGYPLWHIASGNQPDPVTGGHRVARGIIAIGPEARGFLAIGGRAHGFIALGGMATGVMACGGIAGGLVAAGGLSLGIIAATGGLAVGGLARGGLAAGYDAEGGLAAGHIARGGQIYTDAPGPPDAASLQVVHYLELALQGLGVACVVAILGILISLLFASRTEPAHAASRRRWNVLIALMLMLACVPVWREFRRKNEEQKAAASAPFFLRQTSVQSSNSSIEARWAIHSAAPGWLTATYGDLITTVPLRQTADGQYRGEIQAQLQLSRTPGNARLALTAADGGGESSTVEANFEEPPGDWLPSVLTDAAKEGEHIRGPVPIMLVGMRPVMLTVSADRITPSKVTTTLMGTKAEAFLDSGTLLVALAFDENSQGALAMGQSVGMAAPQFFADQPVPGGPARSRVEWSWKAPATIDEAGRLALETKLKATLTGHKLTIAAGERLTLFKVPSLGGGEWRAVLTAEQQQPAEK